MENKYEKMWEGIRSKEPSPAAKHMAKLFLDHLSEHKDQCHKLREMMTQTGYLHKKDSPEQVNADIAKGICAWDGCGNKRMGSNSFCWIHS